jgi:hypothetical protein
MAWTDPGVATVMQVDVQTTSNRGHPPEFWAKLATDRIVQVSDNAHPAIREQALAFKDKVEQVVLLYMKRAIQSDRTTVYNLVTEAGQPGLAELLRRP